MQNLAFTGTNAHLFFNFTKILHLMLLACHKKSYLICDEIMNFRNIMYFFKQLSLPCFGCHSLVLWKKIRNRLLEYSKIRNFVTYQITFLMTCQQHWYCHLLWRGIVTETFFKFIYDNPSLSNCLIEEIMCKSYCK